MGIKRFIKPTMEVYIDNGSKNELLQVLAEMFTVNEVVEEYSVKKIAWFHDFKEFGDAFGEDEVMAWVTDNVNLREYGFKKVEEI